MGLSEGQPKSILERAKDLPGKIGHAIGGKFRKITLLIGNSSCLPLLLVVDLKWRLKIFL